MTTAIMNTFDPSDLSTLKACRALAAELFGGKEWTREGGEARVYDKGAANGEAVTSWAIGNCHVRVSFLGRRAHRYFAGDLGLTKLVLPLTLWNVVRGAREQIDTAWLVRSSFVCFASPRPTADSRAPPRFRVRDRSGPSP